MHHKGNREKRVSVSQLLRKVQGFIGTPSRIRITRDLYQSACTSQRLREAYNVCHEIRLDSVERAWCLQLLRKLLKYDQHASGQICAGRYPIVD